jgi:hypothetical protein
LSGNYVRICVLLCCLWIDFFFSELGNKPHESMSFSVLRIGIRALQHWLSAMYSVLIPQVRPAHKYPISPMEMIHLPGGDNAAGR